MEANKKENGKIIAAVREAIGLPNAHVIVVTVGGDGMGVISSSANRTTTAVVLAKVATQLTLDSVRELEEAKTSDDSGAFPAIQN